jgi:hypothetical protein
VATGAQARLFHPLDQFNSRLQAVGLGKRDLPSALASAASFTAAHRTAGNTGTIGAIGLQQI